MTAQSCHYMLSFHQLTNLPTNGLLSSQTHCLLPLLEIQLNDHETTNPGKNESYWKNRPGAGLFGKKTLVTNLSHREETSAAKALMADHGLSTWLSQHLDEHRRDHPKYTSRLRSERSPHFKKWKALLWASTMQSSMNWVTRLTIWSTIEQLISCNEHTLAATIIFFPLSALHAYLSRLPEDSLTGAVSIPVIHAGAVGSDAFSSCKLWLSAAPPNTERKGKNKNSRTTKRACHFPFSTAGSPPPPPPPLSVNTDVEQPQQQGKWNTSDVIRSTMSTVHRIALVKISKQKINELHS